MALDQWQLGVQQVFLSAGAASIAVTLLWGWFQSRHSLRTVTA
jgi:hypothetical protein